LQFQEANAWTQDNWLGRGGAGNSLAGESQEPLLETGPAVIAAPRALLGKVSGLRSVSVRLSVCIPCYLEPPEVLQAAIDSAAMQLPEESELLIFPNGPEALAAAENVTIPEIARVVPSKDRLSMVGNWNRCLGESRGELIHILHADDAVAPGFYQAVLRLAARYPQATLLATGFGLLDESAPASLRPHAGETWLLAGEAAGRFLMEGERHCCGSVVIPRWTVRRQGPFRDRYLYGSDEEAYLRYAAAGGLAFETRRLYQERAHSKQTRIAAWLKEDFVANYLKGRTDGARLFGEVTIQVAKDSTARRVISVAMTLALRGDGASAMRRLRDLAHSYPECSSWPRYRLAKIACEFRAACLVARLRRRYLLP